MDEQGILARVDALVAEEHRLREQVQRGEIGSEEEQARLAGLEVELDRAWDLLRQRRARRAAGQDPDAAAPRPGGEVEGYLQ